MLAGFSSRLRLKGTETGVCAKFVSAGLWLIICLIFPVSAIGQDYFIVNDICGEDDAAFKGMALGNFPHGCCPILQDNGPNKLDYITVKPNDHLKLRLKAGAASGTGNVQLTARQIRSY